MNWCWCANRSQISQDSAATRSSGNILAELEDGGPAELIAANFLPLWRQGRFAILRVFRRLVVGNAGNR